MNGDFVKFRRLHSKSSEIGVFMQSSGVDRCESIDEERAGSIDDN